MISIFATCCTSIHQHVLAGDVEAVRNSWSIGIKSNGQTADTVGRTPLHLAATQGEAEICTILLEKGADVDARDSFGNTPLHIVARSGNVSIATLHLEPGVGNLDDQGGRRRERT